MDRDSGLSLVMALAEALGLEEALGRTADMSAAAAGDGLLELGEVLKDKEAAVPHTVRSPGDVAVALRRRWRSI